MKTIIETRTNEILVNKREVTKEFAIVESIPDNISGNVWLTKLDGTRVAPMYVKSDIFKQLKPGLLVTYESDYVYGEMGICEKVKIVDIDKLERSYFT